MAAEQEVVIAGISGRFPECDSVTEFWEKLVSGEDLVTDDERRWERGIRGAPAQAGKLKDLTRLDADFFGLPHNQVETMDPQARILLELCYEAIFDAGVNPVTLRGSSTGVFVGCSFNDVVALWSRKPKLEGAENLALFGSAPALLSNRLSYVFDFTGPSITMDSACSASLYALDAAVKSMQNGQCEAAIVAGTNLTLNPMVSASLLALRATSPNGRCRSFDDNADGYVRSEGMAVVFLQRARTARRQYGTIVNIGTNSDGFKPRTFAFPSRVLQARLLRRVTSEASVDTTSLQYLELHGTGTRVGDPEELAAIDEVYCKGRTTPIFIGSVKSNMGHAEGASGLCALVKVLLSMKFGQIPPNLHFETPNARVPALVDGRLKVVTSCQPFEGDLVGINSFGIGGANAHLVVRRPRSSSAEKERQTSSVPLVVGVSGRTQEAVDILLDQVEKLPTDAGLVALLHEIHSVRTPGHLYRGYSIVSSDGNVTRAMQKQCETQRPVWYIFSGFGGQWPTMGKDLLQIPTFYSAIEMCNVALTPFKLNIIDIFNDATDEVMHNFKKGFVGNVAIQIGLVDVLDSLGVKPDGIIGHSLGEIPAGYADGCLTREEAILAAYYRADVVSGGDCDGGAMVAVNLSAEAFKKIDSSDVEMACDNSLDYITLSGKASSVSKLTASLRQQGVVVKDVAIRGVAFHSSHIAHTGPKLLKILKQTISKPKVRSKKWVSSSVDRSEWDSDLARTCSAEYIAHNLTSPVSFRDATKEIPANAIVIELGPHGVLQGALRSVLPTSTSRLSVLTKLQSGVECFVNTCGRLFNCGAQPRFSSLYAPVQFPVHTDTPVLSSLVAWNHEKEWYWPHFEEFDERHFDKTTIDLARDEDSWYKGHRVDGKVIVPGTGYLVLAWKALARSLKKPFDEVPVVFKDVQFHRATILPETGEVELCTNLLASGQFEVTENGNIAATGTVSVAEDPGKEIIASCSETLQGSSELQLERKDIYKELRLRGYQFSGMFQSVLEITGNQGTIKTTNNWVVLIDSLLHLFLLCHNKTKRAMYLPTKIHKVVVDPRKLGTQVKNTDSKATVTIDKLLGTISCEGIQISGLNGSIVQRYKPTTQPVLEYVAFVPYHGFSASSLDQALLISTQIIVENTNPSYRLDGIFQIADFSGDPEMTMRMSTIIEEMAGVEAELVFIDNGSSDAEALKDIGAEIKAEASNCNVALSREMNARVEDLVTQGGYLLLVSKTSESFGSFQLLASFKLPEEETLYLLRKGSSRQELKVVRLADEESFQWLDELKSCLRGSTEDVVTVVEPGEAYSGVVGLVNCLRLEPNGHGIRCVYLQDPLAPAFDLADPLYKDQVALGLTMNIYKHGQWGSLRHLRVQPERVTVDNAYLNTTGAGGIASLRWIQGPDLRRSCDNETYCDVYCSALNFHDVMIASGKLPIDVLPSHMALQDCVIGMEFSGRDLSGRRVMGIVPSRGIATAVHDPYLWPVMEHWTLEEAATVPVVYCTAYYALVVRGCLKPNESVLIHAGTGGVGQAAIAIALHMGCTVFTTVGSAEKRAFLKDRFHQLTDKNIANSRSTSFEQHILQQTNGRGVDVVLNSLAQEKLFASVRCLAENGRFLEIGQFDLAIDQPLGLGVFLKNISFHGIRLDTLLSSGNTVECLQLFAMVQQGIETGVVRPLPQIIFMGDRVQEAFRFMAAGSHIGKVVIRMREKETTSSGHCLVVKPRVELVEAIPRFHARPESVYVVTGGLGGFGLEMSDWLVTRGARRLVLSSRTGHCTGYKALCVGRWRDAGVTVHISTCDITSEQGTKDLLQEAGTLGVVAGIFHLAVVLCDRLLARQTDESFRTVWATKMSATKHLDTVSREMCPALQHFVVFSSAAAGRGNPGQSNYGLASSAAERIVEMRQVSGYPAVAIQWGPIADVGLAADMKESLLPRGVRHQSIGSCLEALEKFMLDGRYAVVGSMLVCKDRGVGRGREDILNTFAGILGVADFRQIPSSSRLTEVGLDSLMQVEFAARLERANGIKLSPKEIQALTVGKLIEMVEGSQDLITKKMKETHQSSSTSAKSKEASQLPRCNTKNQDSDLLLIKNAPTAEMPKDQASSSKVVTNTDALQPQANKDLSATNHEIQSNIIEFFEIGDSLSSILRLNFLSSPLIPVKTLILLDSAMADDGLASPLFLVHPMEGSCRSIEGVARFIERPVYGLQFTASSPQSTLRDLASFYLQSVRSLQPDGPYILGGYSMGVTIAVEMAMQLEAEGETTNVLALDGQPSLNMRFTDEAKRASLDSLGQEILVQLVSQYQPTVDKLELKKTLSSFPEWSECLNHCLALPDVSRGIAAEQRVELEDMIEGCRWRFRAVEEHSLSRGVRIRGNVLVVAAESGLMKMSNMGGDYGFQSICEKKVNVVNVKGGHINFLSGTHRAAEVARIINEYLCKCDATTHAAI